MFSIIVLKLDFIYRGRHDIVPNWLVQYLKIRSHKFFGTNIVSKCNNLKMGSISLPEGPNQ